MSKINQPIDKDLKRLGLRIKELREVRGLKRDVFAREAEISKHYLYRLEYGNANPSILELRKIARFLKVRTRDLVVF